MGPDCNSGRRSVRRFAGRCGALLLGIALLPGSVVGQPASPVTFEDFSLDPDLSGETPAPPAAGREYDDQRLVEPLEILPGDRVPAGTIARVERDFLICTGPDFYPAVSGADAAREANAESEGGMNPVRIQWEGRVFNDVAGFNNQTVESLGRVGLDERPRFETALARFEAGLDANPQFLPFLYNAGRVAFILGDRARAARYFERARELLPEFAGVHQNLGRVYAAGRPGEREEQAALASLRTAARLNPFERAAWLTLGDVYFAWDQPERAREYYAAVLKEIPASVDAKVGLARLALRERDWNEALRLLESASLTYPGDVARRNINRSAYYYLGLAYRAVGAHELAVQAFDRMLSYPRDALFLKISYGALRKLRDQSAATGRESGS